MTGTRGTPAERLLRRLTIMPSGCVEWGGYTTEFGYGMIGTVVGTMGYTHRLAWELVNGPIPEGINVLHHCDNPPCCNAYDTENHLFLGTHQDNADDKVAKGRHSNGNERKDRCPADHLYDEANTYWYKGKRDCRKCRAAAEARRRARRHQSDQEGLNGHHGLSGALRRGDSHADVHMIDLDKEED